MDIKSLNTANSIDVNKLQNQKKVDEQKLQETKKLENNKVSSENDNADADKVQLRYASLTQEKTQENKQVDNNKVSDQAREDRINKIKAQIQSGEFKVNSEAIADKMLKNKDTMALLLSN